MFLSKENESLLIDKVMSLARYIETRNSKENFEIFFENKRVIIFFLGCNFKKLFLCEKESNFMITKSTYKEKSNTLNFNKKRWFNT